MNSRTGLPLALLALALGCGGRSTLDVFGSQPASAGGDDATVGGGPVEAGTSSHASAGGEADGETSADSAAKATEAQPAVCTISSSAYDQSCSADTDCVDVSAGDYCHPRCFCGGAAINAGALPLYTRDVSLTPIGSGAIEAGPACPCVGQFGPCCRAGRCRTGSICLADGGAMEAGRSEAGPPSACPPGFACE